MKPRFYLSVLAAVVLAATVGFAQSPDDGGVGPINGPGSGGSVQSRIFTSARLLDASQNVIGKVKTTTIQTTDRGILQGLRVQASGLTPNAEYGLVIDGTLVGTDTADANGTLKLKFTSPTNGRVPAIPDAIKPISNARSVQLYEVVSQRLVGSGQLSTGGVK